MNVLAPQITQTKALRDRMINYLASFLPDTALPPPPGIPANVLADPGTWRGAGREALNFLVPQPEDTLISLGMPTYYRGINPGATERIVSPFAQGKLFVTPSEESAKWYGSKILKYESLPDARILVEGSKEFNNLYGRRIPKHGDIVNTLRRGENISEVLQDIVNKAENAGYHAVQFKRNTDIGTVILDNNYFKEVK